MKDWYWKKNKIKIAGLLNGGKLERKKKHSEMKEDTIFIETRKKR